MSDKQSEHLLPPGEGYPTAVRAAWFDISWYLIIDQPDAARAILSGLIVIRAERLVCPDVIRYLALGPDFPEVSYNAVSMAIATVNKHTDGGYSVDWKLEELPKPSTTTGG